MSGYEIALTFGEFSWYGLFMFMLFMIAMPVIMIIPLLVLYKIMEFSDYIIDRIYFMRIRRKIDKED